MFGWLKLEREKRHRTEAVRWERKRIAGVRFLEVTVRVGGPWGLLTRRRLRRAARCMERAGVHRALFPKDFEEEAVFAAHGVLRAGEGLLRERTAAAIALRALEENGILPEESCVAVVSDALHPAAQAALLALVERVRYPILIASGAGALCARLRREYGISVLQTAGGGQVRRADLTLTFGRAAPMGGADTLWLPCGLCREAEGFERRISEVEYVLPEVLAGQTIPDCRVNELVSVLLESGSVHENELEVSGICQTA